MNLNYWIKFSRFEKPQLYKFAHLDDFMLSLHRMIIEYGPIEWMIEK
jgi:hypothetical protein